MCAHNYAEQNITFFIFKVSLIPKVFQSTLQIIKQKLTKQFAENIHHCSSRIQIFSAPVEVITYLMIWNFKRRRDELLH